jgi:hypothetical protein
MEIESQIMHNTTGEFKKLPIVFDTGAYMTVIHDKALLRVGYNVNKAKDANFNVVGQKNVPAKEILLRNFALVDCNGKCIQLGPIIVYATDMTDLDTNAVLGLNVIREFETFIKFGKQTFIELTPTFDINKSVKFENHLPAESRFGIWAPSQIPK